MKVQQNVALIIGAFALYATFSGSANAQQVVARDAHFTLPFQAIWADTVLPPGNYTLAVVRLSSGLGTPYNVTFAGAGTERTILAVRQPGSEPGERSMLVAVKKGEMYCVRALHLPYADLVLTFPASNAERQIFVKAPETTQRVPILVAAKERT